jgi:dolichyl-phosphate-mannose-protein mannosyltransferase
MPLRDYLAGFALFLPEIGALAAATWLVVRKRFSYLKGAELGLAYSLLLTIGLLAANLMPLALGVLARGTVLIAALALLAIAWRLPTTESEPDPSLELPTSGRASIAIAALAIGIALIFELARFRALAPVPVDAIDALNVHLPVVARWIQTGSMWQIDQLLPQFATGYYPNSGNVLTLSVVLPWHDAVFARFLDAPYLGLTGVAVYALGCRLGAARATAAVFAGAAAVMPSLAHGAVHGLPDIIMLFGLSAGVLFLIRHARSNRTSDLLLAGLGLGLAFGSRWHGVTSAAVVLGVWVLWSLLQRRPPRWVIWRGAALVSLILLVGGIWLFRNAVKGGDPLYPQPIGAFGVTVFHGPSQARVLDSYGLTVAGYLDDPAVVSKYILPALLRGLAITGAIVLAGILTLGARGVWHRHRLSIEEGAALAVGAMALLIAAVYSITPASAAGLPGLPTELGPNVRWLVAAPMLGAAAVAAALSSMPRLRLPVELVVLAGVVDGIRREPDRMAGVVSASVLAQAVLALVVIAFVTTLAWGHRGEIAALNRRTKLVAGTAIGAAVLISGVAIGRLDERRFARIGYFGRDATLTWIGRDAPGGHRIGLAGVWSVDGIAPPFPAFGPRLDNEVAYVGPVREGLLRQYERRPSFAAGVRRGGYDLLLIGRGQPPRPRVREERWAQSMGFKLVAASTRLALYQRADLSPQRS